MLILFIPVAIFSQIPNYEFLTPPVDIMENFYDYMPGSYNALPIQIEEDGSVYVVFHARETAASTRRIYSAYLDGSGNLINIGLIGTDDIHEGFPGIDLDTVTGDPFVAWHGNHDPTTADLEVVMSYAYYHQSSPQTWREPFIVFNDAIQTPNMPYDCFIWAEVHIGSSPIPTKKRVYVIGKNMAPSPVSIYPSENVLIGYADFDENDLNMQSDLDWTYRTIDLLNLWHNSQDGPRPFLSCSVSNDGKIALTGYISCFENPDSLVVFLNENFGEGDFEYFAQEAHYSVWNPNPAAPELYYFSPGLCNHFNSIFHADNAKVSFLGSMTLMYEPSNWISHFCFMYPKFYSFDLQTQQFSFYDLYIEGANPADDSPMIPWDLNEDGIVDSVIVFGWPLYYHDPIEAIHENNFKLAHNSENGWLAAVWNDGYKARMAHEGELGFEDWLEKPEIAICISNNDGASWSQPIFLNANETPELADMIPVYVYPGDKIEDMGNNRGKLHLFFLNDYSFGSSISGNGSAAGGMQKYCSLEIDFEYSTEAEENIISTSNINLRNFPNPFNPSTTISFSIANDLEFAQIDIYNMKGQKVKTLPVSSSQSRTFSVIWDGTDQNNMPVSSGVYFYNLSIDGKTEANGRCLLLK